MNQRFERGVFTISLDFELIWGTRDKYGIDRFREACQIERDFVIDRLLKLFVDFKFPATWCIVGHLMLDHCAVQNGGKHPEIVPPRHFWCNDWFELDPCRDEGSEPLFYAQSLVRKIQECKIPQEIASHTFSHVIFGDPGCSKETARTELKACVRAAADLGIRMESFVFARNSVGHLDALREFGFRIYRGAEPQWYDSIPTSLKRIARLSTVLAASDPPVVLPIDAGDGLWNVPASMLYFPMHGVRRFVPMHLRVKRAIKGLDAAAREKKIFHLWFHPTNLSDHTETMFEGLEKIFEHARAMREKGKLDFLPMKSLIPQTIVA